MIQVPETAKEVSDHLNEAAHTVGERAVPAADDMSANIMGHAKNFEKQLPAAAEDVSGNLKATAKAAGEQAKIGADEVRLTSCALPFPDSFIKAPALIPASLSCVRPGLHLGLAWDCDAPHTACQGAVTVRV